MSSYLVPLIAGDPGLLSYIDQIKKIPSLEPEEEYILAKTYQNNSDIKAAQKLVSSHLKLVVKIAMNFKGYGLPIVELISEGNLGLMQAVKKFDPDRGFRLSTYAMWWIKASIQEYILRTWSLVKIGTTTAQKKLFFNLGKIKRKIQNLEQRAVNSEDYQQIARELDVNIEDVKEMDIRMNPDYSLNDPIGEDGELMDIIESGADSHEDQLAQKYEESARHQSFSAALKTLNDREKEILQARRLKEVPETLDELSIKFNISKERVRQIENKAFEKLQNYFRDIKLLK